MAHSYNNSAQYWRSTSVLLRIQRNSRELNQMYHIVLHHTHLYFYYTTPLIA